MLEQITSIKSVIGSNIMDIFSIYNEMNQGKQQIRRPISYLYGTFLICAGCFFGAVLLQEDRWIFIGAALLALFHGLLSVRNDRLTYDEKGITLYSIWGKPFHKTWSDILSIDVVEEPLLSRRLFVGRVLRIKCMEKNGAAAMICRFPYRYYVGIDEFLSFRLAFMSKGSECCDESDR